MISQGVKPILGHCGLHWGDDELVTNARHADDLMLYAELGRRIGRPAKRWDDQIEFFCAGNFPLMLPTVRHYEAWSSHEKTFVQRCWNVDVWLW